MNTAERIAELERQNEEMRKELLEFADRAYCQYIETLQRDECKGIEFKLSSGKFGQAELNAHKKAAGHLAVHKALHDFVNQYKPATAQQIDRNEIIEECARVCDALAFAIDHGGNQYRREASASHCAAKVRALKDRQPAANAGGQDSDPNAPWLTLAHTICAEAGVPPGHITHRLDQLRDMLDADRRAAADAGARIDLTDDEAAVLRDYIGDTERPVTLIEAEGRAGYGLYVFDTEYPDECGEFIAAVNRPSATSAAHQEGNLATQGREG